MLDFLLAQNTLWIAGGTLTLAAFALMVVYLILWRRQRGRGPAREFKEDRAHMMLLFQTMRDILEQQKDLARKLNRSLDRKVSTIQDEVRKALAELESVEDSVKNLRDEVENVRERLRLAKGRAALLGKKAPAAPAPSPKRASSSGRKPAATDKPAPPQSRNQGDPSGEQNGGTESRSAKDARVASVLKKGSRKVSNKKKTLEVLANPVSAGEQGDLLDQWVGLDFNGDEPDPLGIEIPDKPPAEPEDPEAAREAFRALLDLEAPPPADAASGGKPPAPAEKPRRDREPGLDAARGNGGNGRKPSPVRAKVYEYSDAGMSISQIAKELGIGKGEIRLMLSLREGEGS